MKEMIPISNVNMLRDPRLLPQDHHN